MLKLTALALLVLAAPKTPKAPPPAAPDPCSPERLKLGEVKKVIPFDLPKGCKPRPPAIRVLVRSEKEVPTRLTCAATAVAGVDFKKYMLVAMLKEPSPGTAGTDVWEEEGRRVTLVARMKPACPNDPKPEPGKVTTAFLIATDPNPPEFAEASCTLPSQCN